jgi:hypothetical protein
MSLNQLTVEGLVGDGLDIECKSISTSAGGGSIFRGSLTVLGTTDLQGTTVCEETLSVVGQTTLFGGLSLGSPPKAVVLDGVLSVAAQGFTPQAGHISNAGSFDQYYQYYGSTLHIQGRFVAELSSPTLSRYFTVGYTIPSGYSIGGSFSGRWASATGTGGILGVTGDTQPYVVGGCNVNSANTYVLVFYSGDGLGPRIISSQMMFSFHLTLDNVSKI